MSNPVHLNCAVCGAYAGKWHQHSNRDNGYGICLECVHWLITERKMPLAELTNNFGKAGINFEGNLEHE